MKKEYDFSKGKRIGKAREVKVIKTFRLDPEVLIWLEKEGEKNGMGYQTFLNWFLKKQVSEQKSLSERIELIEAELFKKKRA